MEVTGTVSDGVCVYIKKWKEKKENGKKRKKRKKKKRDGIPTPSSFSYLYSAILESPKRHDAQFVPDGTPTVTVNSHIDASITLLGQLMIGGETASDQIPVDNHIVLGGTGHVQTLAHEGFWITSQG